MIPCFIQLTTSVVQGIQVVTVPTDQKLNTSKTAQKIIVLKKQSNREDPFKEARLIYEKKKKKERIMKTRKQRILLKPNDL